MKHFGDITKISGYTVPVVDCIIGGSPCQDLSMAGKRAGLDGERSGLYIEQVRIAKEMREQDERNGRTGVNIRPRYMVWENVPGAFSSNKGEDFRIVLEELAKVKDKDAVIPMPPNGKWTSCGFIVGDGWSIAWRVLDAQFWGVPQRRRRITLIADFGGYSAPEVLFIRKSVSGDTGEGKQKREGTSHDAEGGIGADDRDRKGFDAYNGKLTGGKAASLGANCGMSTGRNGVIERVQTDVYRVTTKRKGDALRTLDGNGGNPSCNQGGIAIVENVPYTLKIRSGCAGGGKGALIQENKSATLSCNNDQYLFDPVYSVAYRQGGFASYVEGEIGTLRASGGDLGGGTENLIVMQSPRYIVRRLTPLECERLQGYPDGWTDIGEWVDSNGKKRQTSDAARYKALGNSIALPPWKWVLKRLCACYERDATMASLFDGIGGFPYLWEQLNGKGSCLWASEIEEFPIAVTKVRIGSD